LREIISFVNLSKTSWNVRERLMINYVDAEKQKALPVKDRRQEQEQEHGQEAGTGARIGPI
jgi:DNA-directed RNA polymerase delta subunit